MTWGGICKIIVVGVYLFDDRYIDKSKNLLCFVHAAVEPPDYITAMKECKKTICNVSYNYTVDLCYRIRTQVSKREQNLG